MARRKSRRRRSYRSAPKRRSYRRKGMLTGIKPIAKKAAIGAGAGVLASYALGFVPGIKDNPTISQVAGPATAFFLGGPVGLVANLAISGGLSSILSGFGVNGGDSGSASGEVA